MAMNVLILSVLKQLQPHLPAGASICSLGYPDVMVSEEQARNILGPEVAARLTYRPDSAQIIAWHQLQSQLDRVIDAQSLFDALGLRFTAIDLAASRGCERILDLNQPLTPDLAGAFDVVLDAGTMEHCFNVGQAVRNIIEMAKVGGFVIHQNPMAMVNHGFFNFSPTFYHDFYVQNGHQLISPIYGVSVDGIDVQSHKLHNTGRQDMNLANTMIMCVARKNHDRPPSWPTQTKYLQNPTLKSGSAATEG